jgi:1,4-dihydroxy-2-naphthoate octaprenyltransferase
MVIKKFGVRRACEKIVGPNLMPYILHLRPLEWPIVTMHFLLGTILAVGANIELKSTLLGWFIFVMLLNGGTLAINSVFDKDEGDIGYLRQPPSPPKYLLRLSIIMLLTSLTLGFQMPTLFAWCNAACVVMSVLYSVPPFRLKARAGWDLLINCLGFGFLTPLAGWGLTGKCATIIIIDISLGFTLLFGALYPLTQLYQIEEDRKRGDQTLTMVLGEARSLTIAIILTLLAHLLFSCGAQYYKLSMFPIIISVISWLIVLFPWLTKWRQWTPKQKESGMYRALMAWAITDINILILFWPY